MVEQSARVTPQNLEAEESLLGAMLLSRDAIAAALEVTSANDFYKPAHGYVFDAISAVYGRGDPVDAITVAEELTRAGFLELVGGPSALMRLIGATPSTTTAGTYARIVEEHATLRRLSGVGHEIVEIGYALPDDVTGAVDRAEQMVFSLADRRRQRPATERLGDGLGAWLDAMEERISSGTVAGVPTGWIDLDEMLLGLRPGQLITVAGRPGMGKSAFAAELAANAAQVGPVLVVSAEMSRDELQDRFIAAASQVDLQAIRSAKIAERDWRRISDGIGKLSELPIYVEDDPGASVLGIRGVARRVGQRNPLKLIIVDYLQLLSSSKKVENRQVEVADISRGLKRLAGEMKVPVVALAQLNRGLEARLDKRPTLADLRESGAIENDSDVVAFLFREEYYKPDTPNRGICEVIVAKQRNGPTGTVNLGYDPRYGTFRNMFKGGL